MPYYPPASSGGGYNLVQDEGISLTARTTLDFVGAGVTASDVGGETQISIPGGGSTPVTTLEVNLGSTPKANGTFTITDAAINASSKLLVWQAPGPYTGKGTSAGADDDMSKIVCVAVPGSGTAKVYWETIGGYGMTWDPAEGNPVRAGVSALAPPQDDPQARMYLQRKNKVKGNVKFYYAVF